MDASRAVAGFIRSADERCLDDFESALRRIAKLPLGLRWRAKQIAQQALGIGPYWCEGFAGDSDRYTSPETLFDYYFPRLSAVLRFFAEAFK